MMSLRWLARFLNVSPYAFTTWVTARDGRRVKTTNCEHCDLPDPANNPYCFCNNLREEK
jgi:hypothetical protein